MSERERGRIREVRRKEVGKEGKKKEEEERNKRKEARR